MPTTLNQWDIAAGVFVAIFLAGIAKLGVDLANDPHRDIKGTRTLGYALIVIALAAGGWLVLLR